MPGRKVSTSTKEREMGVEQRATGEFLTHFYMIKTYLRTEGQKGKKRKLATKIATADTLKTIKAKKAGLANGWLCLLLTYNPVGKGAGYYEEITQY